MTDYVATGYGPALGMGWVWKTQAACSSISLPAPCIAVEMNRCPAESDVYFELWVVSWSAIGRFDNMRIAR